jgi:hypothetical protein
MAKKAKASTGPVPQRLIGKGSWEDAMDASLKKKRPPEGWPKPETKKRAAKK